CPAYQPASALRLGLGRRQLGPTPLEPEPVDHERALAGTKPQEPHGRDEDRDPEGPDRHQGEQRPWVEPAAEDGEDEHCGGGRREDGPCSGSRYLAPAWPGRLAHQVRDEHDCGYRLRDEGGERDAPDADTASEHDREGEVCPNNPEHDRCEPTLEA